MDFGRRRWVTPKTKSSYPRDELLAPRVIVPADRPASQLEFEFICQPAKRNHRFCSPPVSSEIFWYIDFVDVNAGSDVVV